MAAQTQRILSLPDIRDKLLGLGAQPAGNSPDEFARFVQTEIAKWSDVIKSAKVTPN